MFRIILGLFTIFGMVHSQTLEEIISYALESHNSLKAIQQRLSAVDDEIALSRKFQNPQVSLTVSDIQLKDPLNRLLEPMQYTSLNFKQKIPYYGTRGADTSLLEAKKKTVFSSMEVAQVALVKEIKTIAYTIWEEENKAKIIDEYIELISKNIDISRVYSSSGDTAHLEAMSMRLALSELKIKQSNIQSSLNKLYAQISYLMQDTVESVEVDLEIKKPKNIDEYLLRLDANKVYKMKLSNVQEKNSLVKVKELAKKINPSISVGYFERIEHEDYFSISIGATLPIYGRETLMIQKVRKEALEAAFVSADYYEELKSELKHLYAKLTHDYQTYEIIENESIPEIEHMFELTSSMLKSGKNLLLYTDILEKKLGFYEQKISAQASYMKNMASLEALLGEI